jgi:hypothetical protein
MIDRSELNKLLKLWGGWYGQAPAPEWDEDSSEDLVSLTGSLQDRLRVGMAAVGVEPVLAERHIRKRDGSVVTIRQAFTAKGKETPCGVKPFNWYPPPDAERVELAALDLYRYDRTRGVVLRIEYCTGRARQRERVPVVAKCLEIDRLTLRRYRMELDLAREWMAGRLVNSRRAA